MLLSRRTALLPILLSVALFAVPARAQSADEVMAQLKSKAAAEHKNILLMFGASWCGNCHLFDKFLTDKSIHPLLDKVFVYADLATGETVKDTKHENIPGGQELQASLGGRDAGFPYLVMLDPQGNPLIDSIAPRSKYAAGGNIGYPDAPGEIEWFMEMLKKGAPSLTDKERASIHDWLKAHSTTH